MINKNSNISSLIQEVFVFVANKLDNKVIIETKDIIILLYS